MSPSGKANRTGVPDLLAKEWDAKALGFKYSAFHPKHITESPGTRWNSIQAVNNVSPPRSQQ